MAPHERQKPFHFFTPVMVNKYSLPANKGRVKKAANGHISAIGTVQQLLKALNQIESDPCSTHCTTVGCYFHEHEIE